MQREWVYTQEYQSREKRLRCDGFDAYCLFCMTGSEIGLAYEFMRLHEDCVAMPLMRMMHKSTDGKRSLVQDILLKGYVFAFVPAGFCTTSVQTGETAYRILERDEDGGALTNADRQYAEWVLTQGGILDVSKAVKVDDKVKIVSGPLLNLQGCITDISKKNRNCRVKFDMMGRSLDVWLPFEWVEPSA